MGPHQPGWTAENSGSPLYVKLCYGRVWSLVLRQFRDAWRKVTGRSPDRSDYLPGKTKTTEY